MFRPFDLLFPLTEANHDRWAALSRAPTFSSERWVLIPKCAGYFWTYRRWIDATPRVRVTGHGYQDLEHWHFTHNGDRLTEIVTLVHRPAARELQIVLRGDLYDTFRHLPKMKQGTIHEYSWRLTRSQRVWVVEVRTSWERAWQPVTVETVDPVGLAPALSPRPVYALPEPDENDD